MMPCRKYEQAYCHFCEEWLMLEDTVFTYLDLDYPRGSHLCHEHYEDMFPHGNCIVCRTKEAEHEMTPMGYWDDEELFFCAPCLEFYPMPKEATQ